jgi:hypothetical protein
VSAPDIFRQSRGLFYDNLGATGAGLVPVVKLKAVGVNLIFEDPRDKNAGLAYRDQLTNQGIRVGLFTEPHWYAGQFPSNWKDDNGKPLPDPFLYRRQVSSDVQRLLRVGDPVVLDFEKTPAEWQTLFLVGIDGNSTAGWVGKGGEWFSGGTNMQRPTAFSNEPHQDVPATLYKMARAAYLPQLYTGSMDDRPGWQELQWDVANGMDAADCFPVYDAADYQPEEFTQGSYLFNQDRLRALWV